MSRLHRASALLSCLTVLSVFTFWSHTPSVRGYQFFPQPTPPDAPAPVEPIELPTDLTSRTKLDAASDYIKEERWPEALRTLQALLDARDDKFIKREDPKNKGVIRYLSARTEAERMIGALSPKGLASYQLSFNPVARKMLDEARERNDVEGLHEVVRRYLHTSAGGEALELVATFELDRGRADVAASCYRRLLDRPGGEQLSALTLYKAALAFRMAGDRVRDEQTWKKLATRVGAEGLRVGSRVLTSEQLRTQMERLPVGGTANGDWPLYRGDLARAGAATGDTPLLDPRWAIATYEEELARTMLKYKVPNAPPAFEPLPANVPVAVAGKIIFRSFGGVRAIDADTGREIWRTRFPLSLEGQLRDPTDPSGNRRVQVLDWFDEWAKRRTVGLHTVLYENATLGTLSSDGRYVYAVEDLALPPHPMKMAEALAGYRKVFFSTLKEYVYFNTLRALDVQTGKVTWEVGGRGQNVPHDLRDAYFLGPPLPVGGFLYALVERREDVLLVCLSADRGELLWSQEFATIRDKFLLDSARRICGAHLTYADGILICPSNSGAVIGFDPLTRRLVWAHTYRDKSIGPGEGQPAFNAELFRTAWKACAPIVQGNRVIFTATDGDSVRCLDLHDGSLVWKATKTEDDLHVAAVVDGKVLVVGKTTCRALNLTNGETLWQHPIDAPSGQGAVIGKLFYLPQKKGAVLALNLDNPKDSTHITCRSGEAPGNLIFHEGFLWSQSVTAVSAYPQLEARLAQVEKRLKEEQNDAAALSERARLRLDKGNAAGAVADLRRVLTLLPEELQAKERDKLFEALTQLLTRDFAAGEKYLEEYRALCKVAIPADAAEGKAKALQAEQRRRQAQYHALLARGREGQGRYADALRAYRDLLDGAWPGDLLPPPEEPAVHVRPDLWVQARVAALAARLAPEQQQTLQKLIDTEWQAVRTGRNAAALERFVTLYGGITGPLGAPGREARFLLADRLIEDPETCRALEADFHLFSLQQDATPETAARALEARARLYTRFNLFDDALACYRALAHDHARVEVRPGKTGAALLNDLAADQRFLPVLEVPRPTWVPGKMKAVELPGNYPPKPYSHYQSAGEVPASCRSLRFALDGKASRLLALDRNSGAERWGVAVPAPRGNYVYYPSMWRFSLTGEMMYVDDGNAYQTVGHLAVFNLGYAIVGIDLLERRIRWVRNLQPESNPAALMYSYTNIVGPYTLSGLFLVSRTGLTAIDPATGEVRWTRTDVSSYVEAFGDERHLYVVEQQGDGVARGLRALRTSDGMSVPIPDGAAAYNRKIRNLGRRLLVSEQGANEEVQLRLYDTHDGKDLWKKSFPAHSIVLNSTVPELLAVAAPSGAVTLFDLKEQRELHKFTVDPKHLDKVQSGTLLRDRTQYYLAFQGPNDMGAAMMFGDPGPIVMGMSATPVNGMLYAFDRASGELCWHSKLLNQAILLERFDDLPVLLCTAMTYRTLPGGNGFPVTLVRSLDKHTGKIRYNREIPNFNQNEFFHSIQVDARAGTIDLIGNTLKVRHMNERKP
jgi:outer membrane protein assembly factor BamB